MDAKQKADAQFLELVRDGVVLVGPDKCVAYLNAAASRLIGWSVVEAQGKLVDEVVCVFDADGAPTSLDPHAKSIVFRNLSLLRRDGEICRVVARLKSVQSSHFDGYFLLLLRAHSRVDRMIRRLSRLNPLDPVTGLLNRDALEKEIQTQRHMPNRWVAEVQVRAMMLSPSSSSDAFKSSVQRVGQVFAIRGDMIEAAARVSENGFGLVIQAQSAQDVRGICERLTAIIERLHVDDARLSSCIGIVRIDPSYDASSILEAAHLASEIAARDSEPEVHVMELSDVAVRRYRKETNFHAVVDSILHGDRIQLFYQPVAPLNQSHETGERFELLSRIVDEEGRLVSASELIADAEANGLAGKIDRAIVRKSFECLYRAYGGTSDRKLKCASINISASSLGDEALLDIVMGEFERGIIDPHQICFEITESSRIKNIIQARSFIERLRTRGCSFSLDDFGSEGASFVRLLDLGYVEYLKVDGALIQRLDKDPVVADIVASISDIAHRMGMLTVAEYVDRESLAIELRKIGIDFAQGYLIGQPMPFR